MEIYVLHHVNERDDDNEDVKLIGIYSTDALAAAAVERLSRLPGFNEKPQGFHVERYTVAQDHWVDGFISV